MGMCDKKKSTTKQSHGRAKSGAAGMFGVAVRSTASSRVWLLRHSCCFHFNDCVLQIWLLHAPCQNPIPRPRVTLGAAVKVHNCVLHAAEGPSSLSLLRRV